MKNVESHLDKLDTLWLNGADSFRPTVDERLCHGRLVCALDSP